MGFNWVDCVYWLGLAVASPFWLTRRSAREKVLSAFRDRMGRRLPTWSGSSPGRRVLVHAVSLGEINAARTLVGELLSREAELRVVVTVTTTTGYARARELYDKEPRVVVTRYPLDFSGAVERVLGTYQPDAVALMELELWPNFVSVCGNRGIPVLLVNGRLTEHSRRRYALIRPVVRRMLGSLRAVCVQDQVYRERFLSLGALPESLHVTGNMKFDTAQLSVPAGPVRDLGETVRLKLSDNASHPILVAGSTGPGEEEMVLRVYRRLLDAHVGLQLVIVPRHPQRFEEVAGLIRKAGFALTRRSSGTHEEGAGRVVLGDTMGELRLFYAMADVVVVGRSLVDLGPKQHGSDMIEAAALGKAVIVGTWTGNFADAMHLLRERGGVREVSDEEELYNNISQLLTDESARKQLADAGQATVLRGRGATARHVEQIVSALSRSKKQESGQQA